MMKLVVSINSLTGVWCVVSSQQGDVDANDEFKKPGLQSTM